MGGLTHCQGRRCLQTNSHPDHDDNHDDDDVDNDDHDHDYDHGDNEFDECDDERFVRFSLSLHSFCLGEMT